MRLLVLCEAFPYPPTDGNVMPIYYMLRTMARQARMHLITTRQADPELNARGLRDLIGFGIEVEQADEPTGSKLARAARCIAAGRIWPNRLFRPDLARRAEAALRAGGWDALLAWSITSAQHAPLRGPLMPRNLNLPAILYARDCLSLNHLRHYQATRKPAEYLQYLKIRQMEKDLYRRYDLVLGVTDNDVDAMRRLAPGVRMGTLPTGVNMEKFHPRPALAEPATVVFSGAMDYRPNADAALHLLRDIWPEVRRRRPGAKLLLVGRNPTPEMLVHASDTGVEITGLVENFEDTVARATIIVSPLRIGTGMKNKVLEAAALGIPMIISAISLEGINMRPGHDVVLVERAEDWGAEIVSLLDDPARRRELADNALRAVQPYSMEAMSLRLVEHARELRAARKTGAP